MPWAVTRAGHRDQSFNTDTGSVERTLHLCNRLKIIFHHSFFFSLYLFQTHVDPACVALLGQNKNARQKEKTLIPQQKSIIV